MELRNCIIQIHVKESSKIVYASLYDSITDELLVSADLNYILRAAKERNYVIDNLQSRLEVLTENFNLIADAKKS